MIYSRSLTGKFAIFIGIFLLIEGIWGLFSNVVFGVLTTNTTHAAIHIVLGIVGIYSGYKNRARGFCLFLGILLLIVGILRFIPGADTIVVNLLNVNNPVAYLNIIVGIVALAITASGKRVITTQP